MTYLDWNLQRTTQALNGDYMAFKTIELSILYRFNGPGDRSSKFYKKMVFHGRRALLVSPQIIQVCQFALKYVSLSLEHLHKMHSVRAGHAAYFIFQEHMAKRVTAVIYLTIVISPIRAKKTTIQ
jgi:hypothetical protein